MASSSRRHSHRHHSALSAVPSLSLSVSTSRASSVFSTTTDTSSPYYYYSSSSSSSPTRPQTHLRHQSIEKSPSSLPPPPLPNEGLNSSIALHHHLACSSSFLALANGGRKMTLTLPPPPPPSSSISPSQRWDDSQLALDLADDTILPPLNTSSSSNRHTIKTKMRQWISPLKKKQRLPQWLSDRIA